MTLCSGGDSGPVWGRLLTKRRYRCREFWPHTVWGIVFTTDFCYEKCIHQPFYIYVFCTYLKQICTNAYWRYSYVFVYVFLHTHSYVLMYVLQYVYLTLLFVRIRTSWHILFVSARIPVRTSMICTYPSPYLHASRFVPACIVVRIWMYTRTDLHVSRAYPGSYLLEPCLCLNLQLITHSAKHAGPAKYHINSYTTTHARWRTHVHCAAFFLRLRVSQVPCRRRVGNRQCWSDCKIVAAAASQISLEVLRACEERRPPSASIAVWYVVRIAVNGHGSLRWKEGIS